MICLDLQLKVKEHTQLEESITLDNIVSLDNTSGIIFIYIILLSIGRVKSYCGRFCNTGKDYEKGGVNKSNEQIIK